MKWRPLRRGERELALVWGFTSVVALGMVSLAGKLAPFLPRCTFRHLTGLPCPTCGSTRAVLALLEGRPLEAVLWNPLAVLAGTLFLLGGLAAPVWAVFRLPVPVVPKAGWRGFRVIVVAALLANWLYLVIRMT